MSANSSTRAWDAPKAVVEIMSKAQTKPAPGPEAGASLRDMANAIRALSMDAVQAANSGHPGNVARHGGRRDRAVFRSSEIRCRRARLAGPGPPRCLFGPLELNALEMSNVAATLASGGMWCPPSPIDKVLDRRGREVPIPQAKCEQVVPEGLANTLTNALGKDHTSGTATSAAGSVGWNLPDGRQDRHHGVPSLVGVPRVHQPVRRRQLHLRRHPCAAGVVLVAAAQVLQRKSVRRQRARAHLVQRHAAHRRRAWPSSMPPTDPRYVDGAPGVPLPSISGLSFDAARKKLQDAGFKVADKPSPVDSYMNKGAIVGTTPKDKAVPGFLITINTSNGVSPYVYYGPRFDAPPPPPPEAPPPPPPPEVFNPFGLPPFLLPPPPPPPPPPPGAPPPPPPPA